MFRILLCLCLLSMLVLEAAEWPVFGGNTRYNASSTDRVGLPLSVRWTYQGMTPDPCYRNRTVNMPATLKKLNLKKLPEFFTEDFAIAPVVVAGKAYLADSASLSLVCVDAGNGRVLWRFVTGGPVRLAPTVSDGRVYLGSDDGYLYCLDAQSGQELWRYQAAPSNYHCLVFGHLTSAWPIRTGITIHEGRAYCAAGILPAQGVYLHAVNAVSGEKVWDRAIEYSAQGHILVAEESLWLPTGRTNPVECSLVDGAPRLETPPVRRYLGGSKVYQLHNTIVYGPIESGNLILRRPAGAPEPTTKKKKRRSPNVTGRLAALQGIQLLGDEVYCLLGVDGLHALTRAAWDETIEKELNGELIAPSNGKKKRQRRKKAAGQGQGGGMPMGSTSLLAGVEAAALWHVPFKKTAICATSSVDTVFIGFADEVRALNMQTGEQVWSQALSSEVHHLSIADGRLYAGTDSGAVICFGREIASMAPVIKSDKQWSLEENLMQLADALQERLPVSKGYICVLEDEELAVALAQSSTHKIILHIEDSVRAAEQRVRLAESGLSGTIAVIYGPLADLDIAHYSMQMLIAPASTLPVGLLQLLRPCGGIAVTAKAPPTGAEIDGFGVWKAENIAGVDMYVAERSTLSGAGAWTHHYADAANTGCSKDEADVSALRLQWVGPPGPEDRPDRHSLPMPPLYANGQLFIAGYEDSLTAIDAYSGTLLWKKQIPNFVRQNISHRAAFLAVDEQNIFAVTKEKCLVIDNRTGEVSSELFVPNTQYDWGQVAVVNRRVFGTAQLKKIDLGGKKGQYYVAKNLFSQLTLAYEIFAHTVETGEHLWTRNEGVVLHPTIAISDKHVFFMESRNTKARNNTKGVMTLPEFFASDAYLVCVDAATGAEQWSEPLTQMSNNYEHWAFLCYAQGKLVSLRSGHLEPKKIGLHYECYDADTGKRLWEQKVLSEEEVYSPLSYGKNMQQGPVSIVGDAIHRASYVFKHLVFDLHTGQKLKHNKDLAQQWNKGNKTCSPATASNTALYFRMNSNFMLDIQDDYEDRKIQKLSSNRPSCWMSVFQVGGLVLAPESGSGCTCGLPLQISTAYAPIP